VIFSCGFVPKPVPETVTVSGEFAACQGDSGLTLMDGVGSYTVTPTELLVPALVVTVMP
jgi:hypothetical protein